MRETCPPDALKFSQPLPIERDEGTKGLGSASTGGTRLKFYNVRSILELQEGFKRGNQT